MIERAPTVVIVAANTGMKTLRLPWCMRWSVMMIVLSMIRLNEMVIPASE